MKKTLLFLMVAFTAVMFTSCEEENKAAFLWGKWKAVHLTFTIQVGDLTETVSTALPNEDFFQGDVFVEFFEDGTAILMGDSAKYTVNDQLTQLTITDIKSNESEIMTLQKNSDTEILIIASYTEEEEGQILYQEETTLTFQKQ